MAACQGKRGTGKCGSMLYRCKSCGNVGCVNEGCTNVGFKGGSRCVKCGKFDKELFR